MKTLTIKELAAALRISERALRDYRKRRGAPTSRDVDEWLKYLSESVQPRGNEHTTPKTLTELKASLMAAQQRRELANAKLREQELEIRAGKLIDFNHGADVVLRVLRPMKVLLDALPAAVAHAANPSRPDIARKAVFREINERLLPSIQKEIAIHAAELGSDELIDKTPNSKDSNS